MLPTALSALGVRLRSATLFATVLFVTTSAARASIGVLVGEPFGSFGTMMPSGHTSLYLDHICVETPSHFRLCTAGEHGAVVSRYHDLRATNTDWLAVPLVPFLYGVEELGNVPAFVTTEQEVRLRDRYWEAHLTAVAPGSVDKHGRVHAPKYGDWEESIGAAFDRKLFLYEVDTTAEQDEALLEWLNQRSLSRRYSLRHANCADFVADAINFLFPGTVKKNRIADFGIMSPKQVARSLDAFGTERPELRLRAYEIPQIPGTMRRSRPLRGAAETFVKTKRYLATMLVLQPEAVFADWVIYEQRGKWDVAADTTKLDPEDWNRLAVSGEMRPDQPSLSTSSSTASEGMGLRAK